MNNQHKVLWDNYYENTQIKNHHKKLKSFLCMLNNFYIKFYICEHLKRRFNIQAHKPCFFIQRYKDSDWEIVKKEFYDNNFNNKFENDIVTG
jgi:hypothetical protein